MNNLSVMEFGAMPKETINTPSVFDPASVDASTPPVHGEAWPDPTLQVSWHRDGGANMPGHVQVALSLPVEYARHLMGCFDGVCASLDAYTAVLTRQDLNKLIVTLRRARDQAYGRDE